MRAILSDDEINKMMSDYRSGGFSGEVLEIAEKDLRLGVTKEQQSWYMVKTFDPAKVRSLSEAIREEMPDSLIKLLYRLDRYQIDVVVKQYKAGIPEEELVKVIHKKYSAHDMQMVFDKMQKELMNTKPAPAEESVKEAETKEQQEDTAQPKPAEEKEAKKTSVEDNTQTEKEPLDEKGPTEESKPVVDNSQKDHVTIDEQNVAGQLSNEVFMNSIEKMMEKFTDTIDKLVSSNAKSSIDPIAEKRLNATIDDMEKKIKSLNKELEMSAGIIATKESEIAGLKERVRKMEEDHTTAKGDNRLLQYAQRMNTKANDTPKQMMESGGSQDKITSDMSYSMTMPDGSVVPIRIEHAEKKNQTGMAALASRLFNGSPWQKSLLNMLIDGHLNSDQLAAIKKARDYHFTDQEIKELIESGLPAEEMSGIIEVVMADRR